MSRGNKLHLIKLHPSVLLLLHENISEVLTALNILSESVSVSAIQILPPEIFSAFKLFIKWCTDFPRTVCMSPFNLTPYKKSL